VAQELQPSAQPFLCALRAVLTVGAHLAVSRDLASFTALRVPYVRGSVVRPRLLARADSVCPPRQCRALEPELVTTNWAQRAGYLLARGFKCHRRLCSYGYSEKEYSLIAIGARCCRWERKGVRTADWCGHRCQGALGSFLFHTPATLITAVVGGNDLG
jgi:hypothetical protein